jgi:hypothetical protein
MARNPKASSQSSKGRQNPDASPSAKATSTGLLTFLKFSPRSWAILVLGAGALIFSKNKLQVGEVFLVIAVILQVLPMIRPKRFSWLWDWMGPSCPLLLLALLLALWTGFSLELLNHPYHRWMIPKLAAFQIPYSNEVLLALWIAMFAVLRLLPSAVPSVSDLSPKISKLWLCLIMGTSSLIVFYHASRVISPALEDNVLPSAVGHYIFDLKDYRSFFDAHIGNDWPVLATWLNIFLRCFDPGVTSALLRRIASGIGDLAFMLFVYLAGKEAVNRRVGLFAAALVAVSQAAVTKTLAVMTADTPSVVMALMLWLFFRSLRNPRLYNFIFWGAAVALSLYTYLIYRPLVPFMIFGALGVILIQRKEERRMEKPVLLLVGSTILLFSAYVAYLNRFYASDNVLSRVINTTGSWLPCMALGSAMALVIANLNPLIAAAKRYPYLLGWVAGVWMCMLLSFPKMADPYEIGMMVVGGVAGDRALTFKPWRFITVFFDQNGMDWITLSFPGDPAYGWLETACGALGIALVVVRPNLKRLYLLVVFAVSFSIYFLTDSYHTLRLMPCLVPFVLLGGVGVDQFFSWFSILVKNRAAQLTAFVLLVGIWEWEARCVFERVCIHWGERYFSVNQAVHLRAAKDQEQGYRVYVGPGFKWTTVNYVLYENHPVNVLLSSNNIYLDSGRQPQDVVIYFMRTDPHLQDDALKQKFTEAFPNALWDDVRNSFDDNEISIASRFKVTYTGILAYSKKYDLERAKYLRAQKRHLMFPQTPVPPVLPEPLFALHPVAPLYWDRSFFSSYNNGFHPGILDADDKTPRIDDPIPPFVDPDRPAAQYKGTINVEKENVFEWTCNTANRTIVYVDGNRLFDIAFPLTPNYMYNGPGETDKNTLRLKKGKHQIKILTCFERSKTSPAITLHPEGAPGPAQSLWSSFDF